MTANLDAELVRALRFARAPAVALMFAGAGLSGRVQWGIARVEFYGVERCLYEPRLDGKALAFIAPVVEGGELIDLAAIDGLSQHVGQRCGRGHGLGLDALAKARFRCGDVHLVERPLDWLRNPVDRVYLFKLSEIAAVLADVPQITCATLEFAERVQAMLPPSRRAVVVLDP